jgi:aspartyl/asparaginyl-tRNA synthetase
MILDELKLLVKDMEDVLVKDKRFKEYVKLKKQVKTIYGTNKVEYQPLYIPYPTIGPTPKCEEKVVNREKLRETLMVKPEAADLKHEKDMAELEKFLLELGTLDEVQKAAERAGKTVDPLAPYGSATRLGKK